MNNNILIEIYPFIARNIKKLSHSFTYLEKYYKVKASVELNILRRISKGFYFICRMTKMQLIPGRKLKILRDKVET